MQKPLSYYINSPRLEGLLGSNFGKCTGRYSLKELLSFTANSYYSNRGGRNQMKFIQNAEKIERAINGLSDPEKLALMKAIIEHLEQQIE